MPPASPHKTPPRRSTRGVPIASPSPLGSSSRNGAHGEGIVRYVWQGAEIPPSVPDLLVDDGTVLGCSRTQGAGLHTETKPDDPKRRSYNSFLRITEPRPAPATPSSPSSRRTKSSRSIALEAQKRANEPSQLRFALGDGVLVACAGNSIGIGLLVGLWEEVQRGEDDSDSEGQDQEYMGEGRVGSKGPGVWEKMCEIRWCYRRQDLPNTMGQMKLVDHEILYSSTSPTSTSRRPLSTTLPLTSLIHTCTIISSQRFKDLYPMWHGDWDAGWAYMPEEEDSGEGEGGDPEGEEEENDQGDGARGGDQKDGAGAIDEAGAVKGAGSSKNPTASAATLKPAGKVPFYANISKACPPTLSISLSFSSFNPHRRPIPIVYYITRALDKFGKGGEGKSWWWVDWDETQRRGRELREWDVVVDRERGKNKVEMPGKGKGKVDAAKMKTVRTKGKEREIARLSGDEDSDGKREPDAGYASVSDSDGEDGSTAELEGSDESEDDNDSLHETDVTPRKRKRSGASAKTDSGKTSTPRKRSRLTTGTTPRKTPKAERNAKSTIHSASSRGAKGKNRSTMVSGILNEIAADLLPKDPYERALHLLHVGATPDTLPCREEEFMEVLEKVEEGVEGGGGGCLYIAGVPGTGKTATVHAVIKQLRQRASDQEIPPFTYVEINGLKVPTPQHAYNVLWEAISGQKSGSAKSSLRELEVHFREAGRSGPRGHTTVVLMDELDQLLTAKQDVVYNFFNWPTMRDSHLYVIAVANRMDLPQFLASKVKSRLGLQSLLFQPYDKRSLVEIVQSRMIAHPEDAEVVGGVEGGKEGWRVLSNEAIELAAAKMAGTNGDARRVLDACRRAVETAIETSKTTSQSAKPVTIREMSGVLKSMTSSPIALFVKQCSLHQKMMMAAMLRCIRREGVPEISWRAMRSDHDNLLRAISDSNEILTNPELYQVFTSLLSSHALMYDSHERHKSMEDRKLALGMDASEVGRVLMAEGERWSQVLAGM